MLKLALACCKVYISESRNKAALGSIEQAAKVFSEARIINRFDDDTYNRVGYTLVCKVAPNSSSGSCSLLEAVFAMVNSAYEVVDLNMHRGSHPRLGVVDHICFHPLANSSLEQTASFARSLASEIGTVLKVPTFLYGAAHENGRTLASIRRELGYFKANTGGNIWAGGADSQNLPVEPDEGPNQVDKSKGVVVIGATQWVDNYNVPIFSTDISAVQRIARRISERGGGLLSVQAMGLAHGKGLTEVACNLLEPSLVGGDKVQLEVERLAQEEGLVAGTGYFTDFSRDKVVECFLQLES